MNTPLADLVLRQRIIVCCGAGGVGKTTTAAALALAGARAGRRVLVLTIDPSKRLAETLGVSRNPPEPVPLPAARQAQAGIATPGRLDAWMLDPKLVADDAVRRLTKTPEDAERVLANRVYQQVSAMVAGMHEYTAMEALYRLVRSGRYDLVVLDTPPSRHALDFLEAPRRLSALVDSKAIASFLPSADSLVGRAAAKILQRILAAIFGSTFASEFVGFLGTFSGIFQRLNVDVNEMRAFLSGPDVSFVLVTSPAPATMAEGLFFQDKTKQLGLPFAGFVLNRSQASQAAVPMPSEAWLPEKGHLGQQALAKLLKLAEAERTAALRDASTLAVLRDKAAGGFAIAVPDLPQGADDMTTLLAAGQALMHGL